MRRFDGRGAAGSHTGKPVVKPAAREISRPAGQATGSPPRLAAPQPLSAGLKIVLFCTATLLAQAPDSIYVNGKVVTVDARFSIAEAFAVTGEKFTAVGRSAEIRKLAGPQTRVVDLQGKTVVPGLEDSHLHGAGGGPGVDLSRARSIADILSAIGDRIKSGEPGALIVSNSDWHEAQLKEQRLPLRRDLDRVSPHNPVVLVRGGHEYILNTAALAKWKIDRNTAAPPGGQVSKYNDGEPNGELVDRAKSLVALPSSRMTEDQQIESWATQFKKLNAAGLTSIRQPGVSKQQVRLFETMRSRGLLTVRVNALLSAPPDVDPEKIRAYLTGLKPRDGDEWLRVDGVKLIVDGGFEGGWMRDAYASNPSFHGLQLIPRDRYIAVVKELNRLGWRVGTHAVGDAAIGQVLDAYEAASAESSIAGKRWAIEHGFIPREEHFARMKALGLVVTVQNHLYLAGPSLVRYWGPQRAAWTTPVRAYLDHGIALAAGTDSPVVPYPPLWTIYHFVTRDTITGGVLGADQKISREEALRISTMGNAYLTFDEKIKGSIEPGKLADFVVLDEDILTAPAKRIEQMKVLETVAGGKTVFP